ncbi:hypothetical protein ACPA9J_16040 [Pseudomonas aeruginosa]
MNRLRSRSRRAVERANDPEAGAAPARGDRADAPGCRCAALHRRRNRQRRDPLPLRLDAPRVQDFPAETGASGRFAGFGRKVAPWPCSGERYKVGGRGRRRR